MHDPAPLPGLTLRPATAEDADRLMSWRNDPATRAASHNAAAVSTEQHRAWLASSLANPDRELFIALLDGKPVGTVRADRGEDAVELSWTVAPAARGRGLGGPMVRLLAERIAGPIRAEVRVGNPASSRIAIGAGMRLVGQQGDVLHYRRPGSPRDAD